MRFSKRVRAERTDCPVVGKPQPLSMSKDQHPQVIDVLRAYLYTNFDADESAKKLLWKDTREKLCSQVEEIWKRASIPIVSTRRIHKMLDKWQGKFRNVLKPYKQRKN